MNLKKRRVFAILSTFCLLNSFVYSKEQKNTVLKSDKLRESNDFGTLKKNKLNNQKNSNFSDLSKIIYNIFLPVTTVTAISEGIYILKQRGEIRSTTEQLKKYIEDNEKKIKSNEPNAFSLLSQKYTFYHTLSNGTSGFTAIFTDNDNKRFVVKILFKSEKGKQLKEIQNEKAAVEFFRNKPQNDHIVFPIEYFEDNNVLFVVYPLVPSTKDSTNGAKKLKNLKQVLDCSIIIKDKTWNNVKKKKLLWYIAKQLFEICKYFLENNFDHNDLTENILISINKKPLENTKYDYNDFVIKVIDFGIWKEKNWNKEDFETTEKIKELYERMLSILTDLYLKLDLDIVPHKDKYGNNCKAPHYCCAYGFFQELGKLIGFSGGDNKCPSIYKITGHVTVKPIDEIIDFCQKQIEKLK